MEERGVPVQTEEETDEEDAGQEVLQQIQAQVELPINNSIKMNYKELALLEIIIYQELVLPQTVITPESTQIVQMHHRLLPIH